MEHREDLVRQMKEFRAQLDNLVAQGRTLTSEEVLAVSQELDYLVLAYQGLLSKRSPMPSIYQARGRILDTQRQTDSREGFG